MKSPFRTIYNLFVFPAILIGVKILSPFISKVRRGLKGRVGLIERAIAFRQRIKDKPVLLFHCASAGEFEALRPIAKEFDREKISLAVSYFSPSAVKAAEKSEEFEFTDYSPADSKKLVDRYLDVVRPSVIAITKHDVWPNFVWSAHERNIPVFLINGNFHSKSLKMLPGVKQFHREVYSVFTTIMTVSEEDCSRAKDIVGNGVRVENVGDSRYDQTLSRAEREINFPSGLKEACAGRKVLIAGSTHFDDENLLIPILSEIKKQIPDLLTLIVPHDPSPKAQRRILDFCIQSGVQLKDLDANLPLEGSEAILINRTGILADLYRLGDIAYIGGGFGKGVHSVLEPMAHGLPVICGVNIDVSYEARVASKLGIVAVVQGRGQTKKVLLEWLSDEKLANELKMKTKGFVLENSGRAKRIAGMLKEVLVGRA